MEFKGKIRAFQEKIQSIFMNDAIFMAIILVLVGILSFGLGRASVHQVAISPSNSLGTVEKSLKSEPQEQKIAATSSTTNPESESAKSASTTGTYVASRTGKKYHLPWCPGVKQMKEENKIWFASKEDAEKAGYTPASNCKGI